MTTQNKPTIEKRLAVTIAGLNVAVMLVGSAAGIWFFAFLGWDWYRSTIFDSVAIIVYSVVGVWIISRYPRHTIGWLFLIVGLSLVLVRLLTILQALEPTTSFGPVLGLLWWVSHLAFIPAFVIPLSLMLLLFPDGQLPSTRWWPIAAAALLGIFGSASSIAFYPWPWREFGIDDAHNPFSIAGSEGTLTLLIQLSFLLIAIGVFGSLAAVVVRYRRSQGIERVQMKWLVYTAVGGMSFVLLLSLFFALLISYYMLLRLPTLLAVAVGIAILRYRLWDIDLIIRRTLVYAVLTAMLALVYFGSVILLESVLRSLVGEGGRIATIISTLVIVVLFTPLRRRVQDAIDRRFYRSKYNAQQTLAQFAATARAETDLEALTVQVVNIVQNTMQPESLSLWIKETQK